MTLTLIPGQVTLAQLESIYKKPTAVILDAACHPAIEASAAIVAHAAQQDAPVYGINTGFGKLASKKIAAADTATLQRNLILSHCAGVGDPLPEPIVRLIMALKLISLGRGASGVRMDIIRQLEAMLAKGVMPVIPSQGSVGASGDLAPLAHMSAVMMGEGEALYRGTRMSGADALKAAAIASVVLGAKEGLGLINGTQVSCALALAGLFDAFTLAQGSLMTGALSTDAAMGSAAPFRTEIHELRGHEGQRDAATALRTLLNGSQILGSHIEGDERVQDPYCIRCQPQVVGACLDILRQAARTLEIEANAATDNPLVLADGSIVSGGNFHAEPVAFAADMIALAIAELGSIAQRRIALMVDPTLSFGLPPFLTPNPGLNSGFMVAEISAAALMSENKQKAAPCSVDSTPTSANQEDHVSMACHGARRLLEMNRNLSSILGIELLTGSQGIEFRAPLATSTKLASIMTQLRATIPTLTDDRPLHGDIAQAAQMLLSGSLLDAPLIHLSAA